MLWLNGASMIAFTPSGEESASPTPSMPSSVRTRTSTESWLLAVFAWMFGMRRIWQTTSVIFMESLEQVLLGEKHLHQSVACGDGRGVADSFPGRQSSRVQ